MSDVLQLNSNLTLEITEQKARQSESVRKQQAVLHQFTDNSVNIDKVSNKSLIDPLPIREESLKPKIVNTEEFKGLNEKSKNRQKKGFDSRQSI